MAERDASNLLANAEAVRPAQPAEPPAVPAVTSGRKVGHRFQPGAEWRSNAAGRPKGSKHNLGEDFLAVLAEDFVEHGADVIAKARHQDPVGYLRVVAGLLPRELDVNVRPELPKALAEMGDADWEMALGIRVTRREG